MANRLTLKTKIRKGTGDPDKALAAMFDQLPKLKRQAVGKKAVKAGADVVLPRARALTPEGEQSDRDLWWGRHKRRHGETQLKDTIDHVVREYGNANAVAILGPKWPEGNKAYVFTSTKGRRAWYWGHDSGVTKQAVRNWIVQAFDETRPQQIAAMGREIKAGLDRVWRT